MSTSHPSADAAQTSHQHNAREMYEGRRNLDEEATAFLLAVFDECRYPQLALRVALAQRLNVPEAAIQNWFQNMRSAEHCRALQLANNPGPGDSNEPQDLGWTMASPAQDHPVVQQPPPGDYVPVRPPNPPALHPSALVRQSTPPSARFPDLE
ncbi:hypothetical protein B0H21DRAFT_764124 [Amylocystis lapponica]|nr:hypothetical protein B0H21DRAFT_764124 [Amylocystis lapponica]